jgi:general secretion pathway protein F
MPAFTYKGLDANGKTLRGLTEADSERHARRLLRDRGVIPVEVFASGARTRGRGLFMRPRRLRASSLALFTQTLATLLQAGLPVDDALTAIINQTEDQRIKPVIMEILTRVREGHTLESALGAYPAAFSDVYRATVGAGEQTRYLPVVLQRLAEHIQRTADLSQRIRLAMVYPAILVVVAIAVAAVLLAYVVPDVVAVFDERAGSLPRATRVLIALSDFIQHYGLHLLVGVLLLGWLLSRGLRNAEVRRQLHRRALQVPVLAPFIIQNDFSRYAQTLAVLLENGVDMVDTLMIASKTAGNTTLGAEMDDVLRRVRQGESLNGALRRQPHVPSLLCHLTASGESAGELPRMLHAAVAALERATNARLAILLSLLEPALILALGGLILFIVLAILAPIMQMNAIV